MALGLHFTFTQTSLRPIGELDLATVVEFQAAFLGLGARSQRIVAVDLCELSFIDSTGLAAIVAAERHLSEKERALVLRHPRPMIKRVLDGTGLTWLLEVQSRTSFPIEAVALRDELRTKSRPYLVGEEQRCD